MKKKGGLAGGYEEEKKKKVTKKGVALHWHTLTENHFCQKKKKSFYFLLF